jgi:glutathione synthase/RimK-type ligase-like ATP-grasp enzyme
MRTIVVVDNVSKWPLELPNVELVHSRAYLTDPGYAEARRAVVYNLCRTYGYQGLGYYVSLLAAARGHRHMPSVSTIQSLRIGAVVRTVGAELDRVIQRSLKSLKSDDFELSIYFGRNVARRYDALAQALFNQFPAPFLRAHFTRARRGQWELQAIRLIAAGDIPEPHRPFVVERANAFFARPTTRGSRRKAFRYEMAILWREDDDNAPSDDRAIRRFVRAAAKVGIQADIVEPEDYGRIAEYDALFLRETTGVEHHTFRFSLRAQAEGLVVVDDPESIIRCTNKVYQSELFARHGIPEPRTLIVHSDNVDTVADRIGFPCVVKLPDSSFSMGVVRVDNPEELGVQLTKFLEESDLLIVQQFLRTAFDWRIGVLGRRPLYACKYHMAPGHWQIIHNEAPKGRYGRVEAIAVEDAPPDVVDVAVRAASLIGRGLYGVDVKPTDEGPVVMEVNDNPSLEAGYEDGVLGDVLYERIMQWFLDEIDVSRGGAV